MNFFVLIQVWFVPNLVNVAKKKTTKNGIKTKWFRNECYIQIHDGENYKNMTQVEKNYI